MTYEKEKITISLEDDEVNDFWDIIMFALDYNAAAKKKKPGECGIMSESQEKLAHKLEEISRPYYG